MGETLQTVIDQVLAEYGGSAVIAVSDGTQSWRAGNLVDAAAWSTIKIPVSIAALRVDPELDEIMRPAVTLSDNESAEVLWESLGAPVEAGRKTEIILAETGDHTKVNTQVTRPGFSSYGQTRWEPEHQAQFAAGLPCLVGASPVIDAMGQIAAGQDYGLGVIPGARYKGGWGPDPDGIYLVRQFGLLPGGEAHGVIAVSVAARPVSGTFPDGQVMLTALAQGLEERTGSLPTAGCPTSD